MASPVLPESALLRQAVSSLDWTNAAIVTTSTSTALSCPLSCKCGESRVHFYDGGGARPILESRGVPTTGLRRETVYPFIIEELTSKKFGMDVRKDGLGDPLEDKHLPWLN